MDTSRYVRVAVNIPAINGEFDYCLPDDLIGKVHPGCLIEVPFNNRPVQGIVTRLVDVPDVPEVKPISRLVDPVPVLTPQQIQLAAWMSAETLTSLSICIDLMLPPGLTAQADILYEIIPGTGNETLWGLEKIEQRIMQQLINRGGLRLHQLEAAIPHTTLQGALRSLLQAGRITAKSILMPPRVRPKFVRTAALACPKETVAEKINNLSIFPAVQIRRQRALEYLMDEPMPVEVTWVYAASSCNMSDLIVLQEMDLIVLGETEIWRDPLKNVPILFNQPIPELTSDQQSAWQEIYNTLLQTNVGEATRPILLQGVTASGKTELYIRAVEETLLAGRQAIILVPEISLTPLAVQRFLTRFPGQIGLIHSRLTPGERYDTWRRARAGVLPVIIGPRSALFTPLKNIGLIVMDECHDDSYYQREPSPSYSTQHAALKLAEEYKSTVILGSATPNVTQLYFARQGVWKQLILPRRVMIDDMDSIQISDERGLPPVEIVDMREELKAGVRSIFSRALHDSLQKVLDANEQAILFLNRRGASTFIFCYDCGHSLRCPRCEIPLTFHSSDNRLLCHHCGYQRQVPKNCPNCKSERLRNFGLGTERVETEIKTIFPSARVLRWDAETTGAKDSHEIILGHFTAHHADILVGTQMVVKGHDFPLVTLVGILLAESGLNLPDYRSPERVFQLITQVAGRAGRSALGGNVIMQTYLPEHYAIQAASRHDLDEFYEAEIAHRERLRYPPFTRLARILFQNLNEDLCKIQAEKTQALIAHRIEEEHLGASSVGGALPCYFAREGGYFRYQVILRSPDPARVLNGLPLHNCRVQIDPIDLL